MNIRVFHLVPEPAIVLIPSTSPSSDERAEVRLQRRDLRRRAERDEQVLQAVVVHLDRELGAGDAECLEEQRGVLEGCDRRDRLRHPPEDDPSAFALEQHRHDAASGLEADLDELERLSEHERGAERGMAGERHLDSRREDPDLRVGILDCRRVDEDRLREVRLAREPLKRLLGDLTRVAEDSERVARERRVGEDISQDVAEGRHRAESRPGSHTLNQPQPT